MIYKENINTAIQISFLLATLLILEGCAQGVKGYYISRLDPVVKEKPLPIQIETIIVEKPFLTKIEPVKEEKPVSIKPTILNSVFLFPFGSAQIASANKTELLHLSDELKKNNNEIEMLIINGYTDRLGNKSFNQKLSQKRAQHVTNYLKSQGINIPMSVVGKGSSQPVSGKCSGKFLKNCLAADRRVEIKLKYKKENGCHK